MSWNAPSYQSYSNMIASWRLSGQYSRDWSESPKVIGVIGEPFAVNEGSE